MAHIEVLSDGREHREAQAGEGVVEVHLSGGTAGAGLGGRMASARRREVQKGARRKAGSDAGKHREAQPRECAQSAGPSAQISADEAAGAICEIWTTT
eukprot:scaffold2343_cov168-Isochrysis_galbana.AAC.3